jgi:hypothetical protein
MSRNSEDISDKAEWQLREELTAVENWETAVSELQQARFLVIVSEAKGLCTPRGLHRSFAAKRSRLG